MPEVVGSDLQALQMERLLLHCVNLRLRRKHGGGGISYSLGLIRF